MIQEAATKPAIELKGIKHVAWASEETSCYTATLYVDGEKWGTVGNDGHGGADYFHGAGRNYGHVMDLDKRLAATWEPLPPCFEGMAPMTPSLELICAHLVDDYLTEKAVRGLLGRAMVYTRTDKPGLYTVNLKIKGRVWTVEQITASYARQNVPVGVILNTLPMAEAVALYKANAQ